MRHDPRGKGTGGGQCVRPKSIGALLVCLHTLWVYIYLAAVYLKVPSIYKLMTSCFSFILLKYVSAPMFYTTYLCSQKLSLKDSHKVAMSLETAYTNISKQNKTKQNIKLLFEFK